MSWVLEIRLLRDTRPTILEDMDIVRGGGFAKGDKKTKPNASTKGGEKKKEPQSRIRRLTELAKSLYRNDFTRFLIFLYTVVITSGYCLYT